jgi:hypothetical protein
MLKRLPINLAIVGLAACLSAGCAGASVKRHGDTRAAIGVQTTSHVETWAFDDGCNGGANAGTALVRQWLTFAESECGPDATRAERGCHSRHVRYCFAVQYLNTEWEYADQAAHIASASPESWWLHEPAPNQGTRIYSSASGGGYLINQSAPAVRSYFRRYVRRYFNSDDALLMDWQSASLAEELYYSTCGCSRTSELHSDAALQASHEAMSAALTHSNGAPFIQADNSLSPNPFLPQGFDMLNSRTGVDGWVAEGEPEDNGTLDPYYSTLLDQIAYIANRTSGFVVPLSRAPAGAPYQGQSRRIQEATILLGYRPGHLVDWADLEQGSPDLAVWPEEGIYPTAPLESMGAPGGRGCLAGTGRVCSKGGHNSVRVAPGVYRREFRACNLRRSRFGACAAIVNTTGRPVTIRSSWLPIPLHHQITFAGGDVQSGGAVELTGAPFTAGSAVLGPQDAVLLAP